MAPAGSGSEIVSEFVLAVQGSLALSQGWFGLACRIPWFDLGVSLPGSPPVVYLVLGKERRDALTSQSRTLPVSCQYTHHTQIATSAGPSRMTSLVASSVSPWTEITEFVACQLEVQLSASFSTLFPRPSGHDKGGKVCTLGTWKEMYPRFLYFFYEFCNPPKPLWVCLLRQAQSRSRWRLSV